MTVAEIKRLLSEKEPDADMIAALMDDPRQGVRNLVAAYMRRLGRENRELLRVEAMYEYESEFYKKGLRYIAGIDEVGRGPLAGPVTVAAVILPPHWFAEGLNDSKKSRRNTGKRWRKNTEGSGGLHRELSAGRDRRGQYLRSDDDGHVRGREKLPIQPEAVIVDAMPLHFSCPVVSLVHGDAKSASVAAASIAAKVHRDALMDAYDKQYPGYGFAKNKGYGTAEHIAAIDRLGITPIHRKSFEPVKGMLEDGRAHFYIEPAEK